MKPIDTRTAAAGIKRRAALLATFFTGLLVSLSAAAQGANLAGTGDKVCGFLGNINSLLNMASIAVVTIAVIFAGYQIAFAHKRIADVAPILIGGLLIGAAGQLANMIIGDTGSKCTTMIMSAMPMLYA